MELTKIDEFMRSRGFTKAIGPIFSEWEFVKDEILLPDRKEGSGNGTVHIYLLEDNMTIFRQCFSEYIEAFRKAPKESEDLCPHVAHFVMTSNVLTVAGFAYMHYKCDANMFNYENFVHKVMHNDDDGMIAFESLFKFTTENRPYFKQFDKDVFGKIIRYVFVPRKTAYKIYLYSDDDFKNFATFWLIGQIPDNTFIVNTPSQTEGKAIISDHVDNLEKKSEPVSTPEDVKQRFIAYCVSNGMPLRTAKAYAGNVKNMIPIAQRMLDGQEHPSPFTIINIEELKSIDDALWANEEVSKWNVEKHHRASAAFRMYIKMFQAESSDNTEVPNVSKPKVAHVMDFTLTKDEEEQKEAYMKFLREERGMVSMSITNYANLLYKKLSPLIRDYYNSDFRNVYAVKDLKALIKMEDEIWDIPEINAADESTKGKLSASFQRYRDFIETNLSDDELFSIAFGDDNEDEAEDENIVKLEVGKKYQYAQYLPLYSVRAACGAFANEQEVETEGWVDVSTSGIRAKENMFVVHAKGDSMEPRIHDNDLCVFQKYEGDELENQIVLTQLVTYDIDYGGMYTIKKFHAEKRPDENGYLQNSKVELLSYNPAYSPIILTENDAYDVKTVGVFVDVLRGQTKDCSMLEDTQDSKAEEPTGTTKRQTIRVEYPDGKIVQNQKSKITFLEVIKDNFPDLIMGIEFSRPLISRDRLPDYPNHQRAQTLIEGGYYVSTNFSNQDKVKILKKISDELDLGLKITLVDKE